MRILISLFATLALCSAVLGYGWEDAIGAWAFESEPNKPCIVVAHRTVWLLHNGIWHPGEPRGPQQCGTCFVIRTGEQVGEYAIWKSGDDWLFATSERGFPKISSSRKIVMAQPPDWDLVRTDNSYRGFWKPVRYEKGSEIVTGPDVEGRMLLRIRDDNVGVLYLKDAKYAIGMKEPYGILALVPAEGQYREFKQGKRRKAHDLDRGVYTALWLQPDGRLRKYDYNGQIMIFERTDEKFDDPIDARRDAAAKKSIHGVWGVNNEFNIFILAFDRGGSGYVSSFAGAYPFFWSMGSDGVIRCTPGTGGNNANNSRNGENFRIECKYDSERNEMLAEMIIIDGAEDKKSRCETLPFIQSEGNVPEFLKRIEGAKNGRRRQY